MNISLTPELEKYVTTQVKSGLYNSSSEVIRSALRMLLKLETKQPNAQFEDYKMWLQQEVQIGLDQAARGEVTDGIKAMSQFKKFRQEQIKKHA